MEKTNRMKGKVTAKQREMYSMKKFMGTMVKTTLTLGLLVMTGCSNVSDTDSEISETASKAVSEVSEAVSEATSQMSKDTYGTTGALADDSYTLEEMLTYAIQDEYLAQAKYTAIAEANNNANPFSNIAEAEATHINELLPLFEMNGIEVPANDASERVTLPDSLAASYEMGIEGETQNISMYKRFLEEEVLPADVKAVFERLIAASEEHLQAFEQENANFRKNEGSGNNPN
ncbi:MAG TPA: ferritin family protein [Trichococcus sp.]|nr:ferritin family protein [Trichococcus sp.]